jgi:uncharacterized protein YbjT (DUF2867 family)
MILVTGPTGFVGRRVVEALTSGGHPVRALVHTPSHASVLSPFDAEIVEGDILDPQSLARACEGVEAVIHLVAVVRERGSLTFGRVNYDGTRNLLEAVASANVRRIIYVSVIGAGPDPAVPYLHSRWMAEQEVERSPVPHTIVRFSVGFGEGDEFFNVLAAQVKLSPLVPVAGDGKTRFQPIAVEDVARCLVGAYEKEDTAGRTIEAGGPAYLTYDDILDLIAETLGAKIVKVHVPVSLMKPAVTVMEAVTPRPPVTRQQLKMLNLDSTTELDSVQKAFGFSPRPVSGNIGYVSGIGLRDAFSMNLGFMPARIRDH